MENNNYFFNDVKEDLKAAFEAYYNLIFGYYDLNQPQETKIKNLSKVVKNEVYDKGGKFNSLFEKIWKLEDEIYFLEVESKKDDKNFDVDKGISVQIRNLYDDAIMKVSRLMFMYGVQYGINLERCISDIPIHFNKEESN